MSASVFTAPGRHLSLAGEITDLTGASLPFGPERVLSFSLSEGSADGRLLGGAFSAACSLTLDDGDGAFTDLHELWSASVRISLCAGESAYPLCVFTAARVRRQGGRLTLSGSDALGTAFEGVFEDDLTYPRTLGSIAAAIAAQAGFPLDASFPGASFSIPQRPDWGEVTLRQALAHVACACGCFAIIDRTGALQLRPVWPDAVSFSLDAAQTLRLEAEGASFGPLRGLWVYPSGAPRGTDPITVQEQGAALGETNSLTVTESPLFPYEGSHTRALSEQLFSFLSGMRLRRVRVSWRGDPALTVGSRLRVTSASGEVIDCLVTGQTLSFHHGFSMQTDCAYSASAAPAGRIFTAGGALNAAKISGALDGVILRDGTVAARALMAGSVTADKLAANSVTADKLSAGDLAAINAKLGTATVVNGYIDNAVIEYARIKAATAESLIARDAVTDRYFIDKLAVRNAQMVQATVGELVIKASDNKYYRLDVAANGSVSPTEVTLTAAEIAAGQTQDGHAAVIETDLTVAELSASSMKAVNALIDKLTASRIDVSELFARTATINQLNAWDIRGNSYLRLAVNRTYSQMADPVLDPSNNVQDGDVWNRGRYTWADFADVTWAEADVAWTGYETGEHYVRENGAWVQKYTVISGIDIVSAGVEISGQKYVRIKSGGSFVVDSGNFSIDSSGNVRMSGTVEASAGEIGGWSIGANKLSSGVGTNYVEMATSGDYAFAAGNSTASSAPFRVKRDGTVYLTKLIALDQNDQESTVNLRTAGLWKLDTANIKNASVSGNTLTIERYFGGNLSVNFNTAASVTLSGSWSGREFTVTASNGETYAEELRYTKGTSWGIYDSITVDSFDAQHRANARVLQSSAQGGNVLFGFKIDASGEYAAGQNSVSVTKGAWSGGQIAFATSAGTGLGKSVQLSQGTVTWDGNTAAFPIMDGQGSTGYTCTVNAQARYNAGYAAGWAAAKALIALDNNVIKGPPDTVDGAAVDLYTITCDGWINSIVNNAPGYYTAQGGAYAYVNGEAVSGDSFSKTVQFA